MTKITQANFTFLFRRKCVLLFPVQNATKPSLDQRHYTDGCATTEATTTEATNVTSIRTKCTGTAFSCQFSSC